MSNNRINLRAAFLVFALLIGFSVTAGYAWAQSTCPPINAVPCAAQALVLGPRTWEQWKAQAGWETYSAGNYSPPEWKLRQFRKLVKARNADFVIFGGSWCPDSKVQLPVLFRLFNLASIPARRQQLYGVDTNAKEPTHTADRFNVSRVPSVIILSNGKEIGRIAEFPRPNWEDDLMRVLSG